MAPFAARKVIFLLVLAIASVFFGVGSANAAIATVASGRQVILSAKASGTSPFAYQWRKDGVNLPGATSATFSIDSVSPSNGGTYSVLISNSAGSILSDTATIIVTSSVPPSITAQPSSRTVSAGKSASFSVTASGSAPLTYQWRKDNTAISGATGSTYSIGSTATSSAGSYSVVVSNAYGSVTSASATLGVSTSGTITTAPKITTQPVGGFVVTAGHPVSFSVAASGSAPLTYQWRKNGINISGATSPTYSIAAATSAHPGWYSVVVANSAGSVVSSGAPISVKKATSPTGTPAITSQPTSRSVSVGQPASFSVSASGSSPLSYRWRKNGNNISGATSSTYSISSATTASIGSYSVVVSNAYGSVTSASATLGVSTSGTITAAPKITKQPVGGFVVTSGQPVSFSVTASGSAPLTYQWRKNGINISGATRSTHSIAAVSSADPGWYSVVVSNSAGSVISSGAPISVK